MAVDLNPSTIPKLPTQQAFDQAIAYQLAGYPINDALYPLVREKAMADGLTSNAAADALIAEGQIWN